jgi:pimeloyl-ACP methyl ester carboxylesterase
MPHFTDSGFTIGYSVRGAGEPLVLLHGNTGSSRMLEAELEYYSRSFQVLAVDLIGHGSSSRLEELPDDFWRANASVVLALCGALNFHFMHLMGTSGGAIVALDMAIEAPDTVRSVVADSFPGTSLSLSGAESIALQRGAAKSGPARGFWAAMQGEDWESVVDADTQMLLRFARTGGTFFGNRLPGVQCPVLLTASLEDEIIHDVREVLRTMARQIPSAETELFESGGHPAMLSNAERFRARAMRFLGGSRRTVQERDIG